MNETIKAKWLWRFAQEEDAMWINVIEMKYEVDNFGGGVRSVLLWSKKCSFADGVWCCN